MIENKRADALRDAVCCILSSTGTAECAARIPAIAKAALAHDNELLFAERPMIAPCRCGHEKGDHQTRLGQRGNYTPCCVSGCRCSGFRKRR